MKHLQHLKYGTPKVIFTGAIPNYSDLSGKDLSEYDVTGTVCMYTNFSNANLTKCKLFNTNFSTAKFYNTNFTGTKGSNILFDYTWFDNTIFTDTNFKNTCFYNVRVKDVFLERAYLNNDNIDKPAIDSTRNKPRTVPRNEPMTVPSNRTVTVLIKPV